MLQSFLVVNDVEGSLNHKGAVDKVAVVTASVASKYSSFTWSQELVEVDT